MIAAAASAYAIVSGKPYIWTETGYGESGSLTNVDGLLTPPSIIAVLNNGYRPVLHPTLESRRGFGCVE